MADCKKNTWSRLLDNISLNAGTAYHRGNVCASNLIVLGSYLDDVKVKSSSEKN